MFENNSLLLIVAASVIVVVSIRLLLRRRQKEHPSELSQVERSSEASHLEVYDEQIRRFKDEIRLLNAEREVLDQAVSYLHKAQAEGKITEGERNTLLEKYKLQMIRVEREIEKNRLIINLQGIIRNEGLEELLKGSDRENTEKSGEDEVIKEQTTKPTPKKTSEERIEEIREEVLKTLDKLDKMDLEG